MIEHLLNLLDSDEEKNQQLSLLIFNFLSKEDKLNFNKYYIDKIFIENNSIIFYYCRFKVFTKSKLLNLTFSLWRANDNKIYNELVLSGTDLYISIRINNPTPVFQNYPTNIKKNRNKNSFLYDKLRNIYNGFIQTKSEQIKKEKLLKIFNIINKQP